MYVLGTDRFPRRFCGAFRLRCTVARPSRCLVQTAPAKPRWSSRPWDCYGPPAAPCVSMERIREIWARPVLPHTSAMSFRSPARALCSHGTQVAFGPQNLRFARERVKEAVQQTEQALSLSFGQQKRVAIASVLAMQSKIFLLDEPTTGQDYRSYMSLGTCVVCPGSMCCYLLPMTWIWPCVSPGGFYGSVMVIWWPTALLCRSWPIRRCWQPVTCGRPRFCAICSSGGTLWRKGRTRVCCFIVHWIVLILCFFWQKGGL